MRPLHHTDTNPGWINRKFKDLERQLRQLRTTTVVNLSEADPSTLSAVTEFETDVFTVTVPGMQVLALDYVPKDESVHVRWHPAGRAGLDLLDEEWTREANVITVPDPEGIYTADDMFSVKYAREGWALSVVAPPPEDVVPEDPEFSSGVDNPVALPAGADEGDFLLLAIMLPSSIAAASNLNGYTLEAETAGVTHPGSGHTYRLAVYARTAPAGAIPVPEFPADIKDTPWVMTAWPSVIQISDIELANASNTTTGNSPAPGGGIGQLRIWGTLGDEASFDGIITPSIGTIVASDNDNSQINIVLVTGAPIGVVPATCPVAAYWCMATLTLDF